LSSDDNWQRGCLDADRTWHSMAYSRGWAQVQVQDVTRITHQTPDCLILEGRPTDMPKTHNQAVFWCFCYWLLTGILPAFLVVARFLPKYSLADPITLLLLAVLVITPIFGLWTSLRSVRNAKAITLILDKAAGEMTLVVRTMRREQTSKYSLQDCQGAKVEAHPQPNMKTSRYACRLILLLNAEPPIALTGFKLLPEAPIGRTLADTINQFLRS
jgi:hypothetical protein